MNKDSITFRITVTFVISMFLIMISFAVLFEGSKKREKQFMFKRNMDMARIFLREYRDYGLTKELEENMKNSGYFIISQEQEQLKILNNKNLKYIKTKRYNKRKRIKFQHLKLNEYYYLHVKTPWNEFILKNLSKGTNNHYTVVIIFLVVFLAFIFLYITTLKKLKPLKILKNKMENLGDEEFDIECSTSAKDEISLLANEFDKSVKKLKKLKESRNVFIRNIMHELKTPITKGKFLTELPQTEENNLKMQKVFNRLESLIGEFASIEELLSAKKKIQIKNYKIDDIVDNAIDILMCDENQIEKQFQNIKISVDFKLFSIAIKNLLDNGIKYSNDKKVIIKTQDKNIIFENVGEKLKYSIESYYEPFFKGNSVKSDQSFGLGLYIVKHVLDANSYKLRYLHVDGINKFILSKG